MNEFPNGWSVATLGDLLERIEAGLNVKCEERPPEAGERGLVKISAVTWGKFDELQSKTLPADVVPGQRNLIREGDLLISRANTIELVGASVIVGPISRELYLSDKVLRLCVHEPSKRWINYALKTPAARKSLEEASSGNQLSMRNISQEKLKSLSFPLAPEAEQARIADKLDTVLSRVDAVNARLARVAPLLKRFRQSVLAAATSGRLTEDWRDEWQEAEWLQTEVHRVADVGTGSTPLRSNPEYFSASGMPWVTSSATGNEIIVSSQEFVTQAAMNDHRLKVYPPGTLLVAMYGEGKTRGQVSELGIAATINQACAAVVVDEKAMLRKFVKLALQANYLEMRTLAEGGNQPNLNLSKIKGFALPHPGLQEQTEIVRRVETLFAFADRLEARLKAAQTAAQRLTPALLAKAFRGELVPQDPADEPAAELLKRLAAQRAAATLAPRRSKSAC
jgi:type I restriction enzyme S subunit